MYDKFSVRVLGDDSVAILDSEDDSQTMTNELGASQEITFLSKTPQARENLNHDVVVSPNARQGQSTSKTPQAHPRRNRNDAMRSTTQLVQPPRNRQEWHSTTQTNMSRVTSLTQSVFDQIHQNQAAEQAARKAMQEHAKREKEKQRLKVHARMKEHQEVIKATYRCMKEIEHSLVQVEGAEGRLTAERYACFAETKVCERRFELREKRPAQELFRDSVQRSLERQLEELNTARQELLEKEAEGKRFAEELHSLWDELAKDIGNRRLAMRFDLATINGGEDVDLCSPENISDSKSKEMSDRAYKLSLAGLQLNDYSEVLVSRIKRQSAATCKQVAQALALHTKELAGLRSTLARQVEESKGAIDKAEVQMRHLDQRLEMGDESVRPNATALKALLRDLRASKQKTIDDLRSKTAALEIDNSCRRVTPQMATSDPFEPKKPLAASSSAPTLGAASKMSKTMGQWKMAQASSGNPQQGDEETARPSPKQMRHTASSGGFAIQAGSSPAGGSNPLKAAAAASFVQGH